MQKLTGLLCLLTLSGFSQTLHLPLQKEKESSFYISEVIDARKDTLNNGSVTINTKKTAAQFENGLADQVMKFSASLYTPKEEKLPVVLKIKKLTLSDRPYTNSRIYKADITLEFLRRDHSILTRLVELSTWVEQGAGKNAISVQEKNISDILLKMFSQFDELASRQVDDPLFAHEILFKVTGEKPISAETDTIYWSSNRKLSWSDFKGDASGNYYAALSNCAFSQSIEPGIHNEKGVINIYIRAAFLKRGSWVRKSQANNEVLNHEQLHFDIAEWQVRKLRKAVSEADLNLENYEAVINKLSDAAWTEYNKIQAAYDEETQHGTIDKAQEKWNKLVAEGLTEFNDYR
jgi:hypothetical protein